MKRPAFGPSWALYLIAVLLVLFAGISWAVSHDYSRALDVAAILSLRNGLDAIGPVWMAETARDVTSLGSVVVVCLIVAAFAGYLFLSGRRNSAILVLVAAVGGLMLNDLLKIIFDRPRPDLSLPSIRVFTSGFPSGHAALSTAAYFIMASLIAQRTPSVQLKRYIMATATLLVLLIGMSRVYLGVHYPTDVLAGWCVGASWALVCWLGHKTIEARQSASRAEHR